MHALKCIKLKNYLSYCVLRSPSEHGFRLNLNVSSQDGWAVVVTQLVEWSLLTPEICGSSPVISKTFYIEHLFTIDCIEKTKIKKKRL